MNQIVHHVGSKKSLYIFLCSLLGMLLFVILQKSALLLLTVFLNSGAEDISVLLAQKLYVFETLSYIMALFFGGWYGVWLGLHWYDIVYESGNGGLFYAFWGKLLHHYREPVLEDRPAAPAVKKQAAPAEPAQARWQFDDLIKTKPAPVISEEWTRKVSVKPRVAPAPAKAAPKAAKSVGKKSATIKTVSTSTPVSSKVKKTAVKKKV